MSSNIQRPQSIEFQELKPKFWQALYSIYITHHNNNITPEEQIDILKGAILPFGYNDEMALKIATAFFHTFDSLGPSNPSEPIIINASNQMIAHLSLFDIKELKTFAEQEIDNRPAFKLLLAFVIYARMNPHPSFWIKYDRPTIFFLAGLQELKSSEQEHLTKYLHEYYNLSMQVVGSKTPIPCFKLKWMADQPDPLCPETTNPLIDVGTYSPVTIDHLMSTTFATHPTTQNQTKSKGELN